MDEHDLELRKLTYALFVDYGRAPTLGEAVFAAGSTTAEIEAGWRRLHEAHALVLNPATTEIRMANPFSAVPSAHRVYARRRVRRLALGWAHRDLVPGLRRTTRNRRARSAPSRSKPPVPLPGARCAVVG